VSPEVVKGAGYDWKSDVWSLGCLLYELALLRSPFEMEGASLMAVFKKISEADYEALQVTPHEPVPAPSSAPSAAPSQVLVQLSSPPTR
jgi:serine/threonine protein kinase